MTFFVVWTEQAALRLVEIEEFVAADDPRAAAKLVERLLKRGESLARLPNRGRRIPELPGADLRELVDGNYRIVYRLRAKRVEVLTVFEAHRLLPVDDLDREG